MTPDEGSYNSVVQALASAPCPHDGELDDPALWRHGTSRFAEALQLYRSAVERGILSHVSSVEPGVLDLHDLSAQSARLAVAVVLSELCLAAPQDRSGMLDRPDLCVAEQQAEPSWRLR